MASAMTPFDLSSQVTSIIATLNGILDEIGVAHSERQTREQQVFASIVSTLDSQLDAVAQQKKDLISDAEHLIHQIGLYEDALHDQHANLNPRPQQLDIKPPLTRCVEGLQGKRKLIAELYKDRLDQVNCLATALRSYASHLEPEFLSVKLPPADLTVDRPTEFSLSPHYVDALDAEFTRVHREYNGRVSIVQRIAQEMVTLWAELGTPQVQTDPLIIRHYRDSPEQLGLRADDITNLRQRLASLKTDKQERESQIADVRRRVQDLWELLQVDEQDRCAFVANNRGFGTRVINEYDAELDRLLQQKRQHLGLFIEDARCKIQQLWDDLYFSEEEMIEFTPAFQDVPTDALLAAHEGEIDRLKSLRQQRAPLLDLISKYRTLIQEREDLTASSQDGSRLLLKGAKGEKRDPTRLLREEKMRKRIAKDLPRVTQDLRVQLEGWENDYGRPFLVRGERYIDAIDEQSATKPKAPSRSKTPSMPPPPSRPLRNQQNGQYHNAAIPSRSTASSRSEMRKPLTTHVNQNLPQGGRTTPSYQTPSGRSSPSKIPTTRPMVNSVQHPLSPRRHIGTSKTGSSIDEPPVAKFPTAPPPKVRAPHDGNGWHYEQDPPSMSHTASSISEHSSAMSRNGWNAQPVHWNGHAGATDDSAQITSRLPSATSATTVSGSENWETYDDGSENEVEGIPVQGKQMVQYAYASSHAPRPRMQQLHAVKHQPMDSVQVLGEDGRLISGSEGGWTDVSGEVF